jgi:hypothetical protein
MAGACLLVGVLVVVHFVVVRVAPGALEPQIVPFFDRLATWSSLSLTVAELAVAVALLGVGSLLWVRHRYAPLAFLLGGWGGLAFTIAALWPGRRLRFAMRMAENAAERSGAPSDTTFVDLIPDAVWLGGGAFAAVWLALLILGTVHAFLHREIYAR